MVDSSLPAILGILTGLIITLISKYNSIQKAYQATISRKSAIKIYEERKSKLLDKANRVTKKYMTFEESLQTNIAKTREEKAITSSEQFQVRLENYPDLKTNESIMELLKQIYECETLLANVKGAYNVSVEMYNSMISSFPEIIIANIFKFKKADYYNEPDDIIPDEDLGI